jgi:hypothetical protein
MISEIKGSPISDVYENVFLSDFPQMECNLSQWGSTK